MVIYLIIIYIYYIYIIIKEKYSLGGVSKTYLIHDTLYVLLFFFLAQFNYFYYLCRTKNINNPKPINPTNPNVMIIKHLQGGGYRLLLPPSMQCVARLAIPAILFAMTICLTSCATARQGDQIKVYNKVGDRVQL